MRTYDNLQCLINIDFSSISTKDKVINAAEDSKRNRTISITLKNVIIGLEFK